MPLYGDGVTRNFLTILEHDTRRSAKSLLQVAGATAFVLALAWLVLYGFGVLHVLLVPGAFLIAFAGGALYTRQIVLEAYEVSLREHWNRWMRWSVSCRTVRECYAKVHDRPLGPSWWFGGVLLALLVVFHLVMLGLALNEVTGLNEVLPMFLVDAVLIGFLAGRRTLERRWYARFLNSCSQLLRDGAIGLWGVY